ncbi:MAG: hypothetical protein ACTHMS_11860 [Jatrophihabitans sp.]|uniref:hypothetical protein n=1 Tax=Jatrophihabitans sp. TaxID=1932789 RepID=UPI003F7EA22D
MCNTHDHAPVVLGDWVEYVAEPHRDGSLHRLLVNRRDRTALRLGDADAAALGLDGAAGPPPGPDLLDELRAGRHLACSPPIVRPRHRWAAVAGFVRTLDVHSTRGVRAVDTLYRCVARHLFRPAAVAVQAALALAGLVAIVHAFSAGAGHLRLAARDVPCAVAISLVAIALHELAHALVVVHHGRQVDAFGFRLHLGTPAFYVESVDALLLDRRARIVQAFAGSWAEWLFTSSVALVHWAAPDLLGAAVVSRFLLVNCITVASNLLPFAGLDGQFIAGDLAREPDLAGSARGSMLRLAHAWCAGQPVTRRDRALAAYRGVDALVSLALLLLAGVFWSSLFGGVVASAWHGGTVDRLVLVVALAIVLRPSVVALLPRVAASAATPVDLVGRVRFRLQWRWRLPAITALAASAPRLAGLDDLALGRLAGRLVRVRTAWRRRRGTVRVLLPDDDIAAAIAMRAPIAC